MSRNTKIIIGVVAGLALLCLIACGVLAVGTGLLTRSVVQNVKTDPADAASAAQAVATFDVPPGYTANSSLHILGVTMVSYENTQKNMNIILIQMPTGGDINETTIQQLQQTMERQYNRGLNNLQTLESKDLTIRGKPARMILQEGTNSEGTTFRQEMVAFQGEGGLAMLTAIGPASGWDQGALDKMVASIR